MLKWPYDPIKSAKGKLAEPITTKQISYILFLIGAKPYGRYISEIMNTIRPAWNKKLIHKSFYDLTKGEAGFVIAALLGSIRPVDYAVPGINNEEDRQRMLNIAREIMNRGVYEGKNRPMPLEDNNSPLAE